MNIKHFCCRIVNLCLVFSLLWLPGMSVSAHAASAERVAAPILTTDPSLPRTETLYFNGLQWDTVACWNPYSSICNNSLAISQGSSSANARVTVFETPYIFNMLDGEQYPLLADGDYTWNTEMTEITFTIKSSAHWSDGTPVTANDVAYTWTANVMYETSIADTYFDYIDAVEAVNPQTVRVRAKLNELSEAVNPLMVSAYLSNSYVIQKAWTQTLEARSGGDAGAFRNDPARDVVGSGPYKKHIANASEVVLIRDNNYWGQDASMWGKLPAPKYLAHIIYPDNATGLAALRAGDVDVSQQFIANVQNLWLVNHLPISTYYPDAPYGVSASLTTAYYNLDSYGLDQVAVRKAIAMAVDYEAIIANAMTNQSPTFTQVPRSIMNPTPGEQALYDQTAVASLQWAGSDIAGANALLDAAGIVDTNADTDSWREFNGQNLSYNAVCPNGWSDWQAAIELVAAAGNDIGIEITTLYPEWSEYQTVFTDGTQTQYDIFMVWTNASGPTNPWARARQLMSSEFANTTSNWNGNWGGYVNPAADDLIEAIPTETDPVTLKSYYTQLTEIYLTDVPSFTLLYRPEQFYTLNESVWTGFPKSGDGTTPPVPPLVLIDGYGIAGLYNLEKTLVPVTPANGELLSDRRPAFDWSDSPNASSYKIAVSTTNSFSTTLLKADTIESEYISTTDLPGGKVIYWRVRAQAGGVLGPWSETWSFTTPKPPSIPVLSSPADNALVKNYTPLLDWNNSTVSTGTVFHQYEVQVAAATNPGFEDPLVVNASTAAGDVTASSFTLDSGLVLPNNEYLWRVRSVDTNNNRSSWSTVWSFRAAIEPPVLSEPTPGAILTTRRPTLDWEDVTGANGGYKLVLSRNADLSSPLLSITWSESSYDTSYWTVDLPANKVIYWRVRALGTFGPSGWSETRSFTTGAVPSTPVLVSPANNALTRDYSPLLDWNNVSLPTGTTFDHYQIQVTNASDTNFSAPFVDQAVGTGNIGVSSFTTGNLAPDSGYLWRVEAVNSAGVSSWSAVRSFRTAFLPPVNLAPTGGTTVGSRKPALSWDVVSGASGYSLQISTSSSFATLLVNTATVSNAFTPSTNLPINTTIYWRVRATGTNGPSGWTTASFHTP